MTDEEMRHEDAAGPAQAEQQPPAPETKKKKKKKKGNKGADSETSSESSGASAAANNEIPEDKKEVVLARINQTLMDAEKGELELIDLDNMYLRNKQLNNLIKRLIKGGSEHVMTMSFRGNNLTDDACKALSDAFDDPAFCPSILTLNMMHNARITGTGESILQEIQAAKRKACQVSVGNATPTTFEPDEGILSHFKQGAVLTDEEQQHARPSEQWTQLKRLLDGNGSISAISQVMREICDAAVHEVIKEEQVDPAEQQAQGGLIVTNKVCLPPGEYCLTAAEQLPMLKRVLTLVPAPIKMAGKRKATVGVGSHRFHAAALVCHLVRIICDSEHSGGAQLLPAIERSGLLAHVAHLSFSAPNNSCIHTAFLDAVCVHTLPSMPRSLWQPLLSDNLGVPSGEVDSQLASMPALLFHHCTQALKQTIGMRSGLMGIVIHLGRDLLYATKENPELRGALNGDKSWQDLIREGGPLSQLMSEQQGGLAGGTPNAMAMAMTEGSNVADQEPQHALLGVREYVQMHQSLNLGGALH